MGARILVVDDSVTIQKVVELTFSKEDFVLVQARSGDEGIRKAMEDRPDLILLDILMPDKDGYAVCAELRAQPILRNVPIILLTGTFEVYDKEKAAKVGADDFVTKPFESQVLIGKVKKLLFTKSLAAGAPPSKAAAAMGSARALSLSNTIEPPKPAPAAPQPSELSAPSLEISQDQLWQLLEAPTPPPAPAPTLDFSLDVLEPAPAAGPPEVTLPDVAALDLETVQETHAAPEVLDVEAPPAAGPSLDLSLDVLEPAETANALEVVLPDVAALDLEAVQAAPAMPGGLEPETPPAPEEGEPAHLGDLSLDDLLAGVAGVSAEDQPSTQAADDVASAEMVFDLTPSLDAPPLPMVEAGSGEPPSLSIEDLLSSIESGSAESAKPAAPVELPEVDLLSVAFPPEEMMPLAAEVPGGPPADFELGPDLHAAELLTEAEAPPVEEVSPQAELGVPDLDLEMAALEPPAAMPAAPAVEAPALDLESVVGEPAAASVVPDLSLAEVAAAPAPAPAAAPSLPEAGLAGVRDAVTERVARDLARELSEKLMERIEKVIWEVVPDLAEVLIAREIERIRRMAEEQKSA